MDSQLPVDQLPVGLTWAWIAWVNWTQVNWKKSSCGPAQFKLSLFRSQLCIIGFCLIIQSDILCVLTRLFKPSMFNVIVNMIWFNSTTLLFVSYLSHWFFLLFCPFSCVLLNSVFFKSLFSVDCIFSWLWVKFFCFLACPVIFDWMSDIVFLHFWLLNFVIPLRRVDLSSCNCYS